MEGVCGVLELTRGIVGRKVWHHVYVRNVLSTA